MEEVIMLDQVNPKAGCSIASSEITLCPSITAET